MAEPEVAPVAPSEPAAAEAPAVAEAAAVAPAAADVPAAAAAAAPEQDSAEEDIEVPAAIVEWLAGRLQEVERLSGAKLELKPAEGEASLRQVRVVGSKLKVARARVLLDSEVSSAPAAAGGEAKAARAPGTGGRKVVNIAGRSFSDRESLDAHVKRIQNATKDGAMLGPEDSFFMYHLSTFHPHFLEKMTAPVVGFKYGPHELFPGSRCFFIVRSDGTEEGLSAKKCVEVPFPNKGKKRTREEEPAAASGAAAAVSAADEEDGAAQEEETAAPPPAQRPRREITTGCIVIVEGVPGDLDYSDLRDLLGDYGNVRFVEFIHPPRPVKAAGGTADMAVDSKEGDAAKEAEGSKKAEGAEAPAAASKEEGTAAEAVKEEPAVKEESTVKEEAKEGATGAGEAEAKDDEDEEDEAAEAEDAPRRARARFADAEGAKKCVEQLKEIDGVAVTCRVLAGEEEKEFWERLWDKADSKGGKGKGKKGKDKGKGKGKDKGKKGKGKGKGKKGKGKGGD